MPELRFLLLVPLRVSLLARILILVPAFLRGDITLGSVAFGLRPQAVAVRLRRRRGLLLIEREGNRIHFGP